MREHERAGVVHQRFGHIERARASIRVARLSIHGRMLAGKKVLDRDRVFMVISCVLEDDPAREAVRLPRT